MERSLHSRESYTPIIWTTIVSLHNKGFHVRTYPTINGPTRNEYCLISSLFAKVGNPTSSRLGDSEFVKKELIFKKLTSDDFMTITLASTSDHGYRFFTGAAFFEVSKVREEVVVSNSFLFIESDRPTIELHKEFLSVVFGMRS